MKGHAAADWMTLSPELVGTLDVRGLLETHDGALVYSWYHGRLDLSKPVGSGHIYAAPLYETGDERYTWLNTIQAVGKGTLSEDAAPSRTSSTSCGDRRAARGVRRRLLLPHDTRACPRAVRTRSRSGSRSTAPPSSMRRAAAELDWVRNLIAHMPVARATRSVDVRRDHTRGGRYRHRRRRAGSQARVEVPASLRGQPDVVA